MRNNGKVRGFTLIELIAVLVIMAIIALIVTPLVMSIIRKARISADKRSIDAYGRSVELAIANYLLNNGEFPTDVSQLTIEYSGDKVVCETTQLNNDSSVYLAGCTVGGRSVEGYTYGKEETVIYDAYEIGDEVTYNNVNYYVIKDSGAKESAVTLLKAEPLTVAEVNQFGGVGTANNHVNMYVTSNTSESYYRTAFNQNGYGGMAYYSNETCGRVNDDYIKTGCTNSYAQSEVKYVVDAWKNAMAPASIEARLITVKDLEENLGYENQDVCSVGGECETEKHITENTPAWVYNSEYGYFTGSSYTDSSSDIWVINSFGSSGDAPVLDFRGVVRPVITISKSYISNKSN